MTEIKRLDWDACDEHGCHCNIIESAEGDMVCYVDHLKIVGGLQSQLQQLAAENMALKEGEPAPFSKLMMEALDIYQAGADDVPELAMLSAYKKLRDGLKTPATSAFIEQLRNEARAEGVQLCMSEMLKHKWQECEGDGIHAALDAMATFIGQLRNSPEPDTGIWIEWNGGWCPVQGDAMVNVRFRNGGASREALMARGYRWPHHDNGSDIIAYRVCKGEVQS